jgi:hypothetical protein
MKTERETVIGKLEGTSDKVEAMKKWLKTFLSPKSITEKVEFINKQKINSVSFREFRVRC